ncbi:hypothetical protein GS928_25885 [Rhodococcus hoagii]|nr:hypothetical protein [Prescottella equi]
MPAEVDTILSVQGGDEAWRAITDLKLQMDQLPDDGKPKTVTMQVKDEDAGRRSSGSASKSRSSTLRPAR